MGAGIDIDRAVADREYFFEIIRKMTKIPDLLLTDVKTLGIYRFAFLSSLPML